MSVYVITEFIFGPGEYASRPPIDLSFCFNQKRRQAGGGPDGGGKACLPLLPLINTNKRSERPLLLPAAWEQEVPARRTGRLIDCSHGVFLPTRGPRRAHMTSRRRHREIVRFAPPRNQVGGNAGKGEGEW